MHGICLEMCILMVFVYYKHDNINFLSSIIYVFVNYESKALSFINRVNQKGSVYNGRRVNTTRSIFHFVTPTQA